MASLSTDPDRLAVEVLRAVRDAVGWGGSSLGPVGAVDIDARAGAVSISLTVDAGDDRSLAEISRRLQRAVRAVPGVQQVSVLPRPDKEDAG